jgi:hypothetical protein
MQRIRYTAVISSLKAFYSLRFSYYVFFGIGEMISDKDKCPGCKGSKVAQEKKVLEVHIEKGMQHGQKIVFQGEADEAVSICYSLACSDRAFCNTWYYHIFNIY